MLLREYETTFIVRPDVTPAVLDTTIERVRDVVNNTGGKMLEINHWGKKKLAYDIAKQSRGIYFHTLYLAEGPTVKELERTLRISDNIMRYLTVQLKERIDPESRIAKEFVRPQYELEEAKAEGEETPGLGEDFVPEEDDDDDRPRRKPKDADDDDEVVSKDDDE